ncbi:MAG TPA: zf-HC2 domain-containing protein [Myxococcales bacterium]|jgi:hypothetical protein
MGLFSRHIDRLLADFSAGDLSPAKARRVLDHAKGCERCGALLNEVIAAQRVLQGSLFKPTEQEQAAWASGAAAVVAASAAAPARSSTRGYFLAFAAAAAAACLALFVLWPRPGAMGPDEFGVRGDGKSAQVSLRVFCSSEERGLVELSPPPAGEREGKDACPVGSSLGFAAGAVEPLRHVRLVVVENGDTVVNAVLPASGKPGTEEVLEASVALRRPGTLRIEVVFAASVEGLESSKVRLLRDVAVVEAK